MLVSLDYVNDENGTSYSSGASGSEAAYPNRTGLNPHLRKTDTLSGMRGSRHGVSRRLDAVLMMSGA